MAGDGIFDGAKPSQPGAHVMRLLNQDLNAGQAAAERKACFAFWRDERVGLFALQKTGGCGSVLRWARTIT